MDGRDRVMICDRENNRVQLFDYDGGFVAEWTGLLGPADAAVRPEGLVYVVEQGDSIKGRMNNQPNGISISRGRATWSAAGTTSAPATMVGGHGIALDVAATSTWPTWSARAS